MLIRVGATLFGLAGCQSSGGNADDASDSEPCIPGVECESVLGAAVAPDVQLSRIDLVDSPSLDQIMNYACHEWVMVNGFGCGNRPSNSAMLFSFDVVFDVENKNAGSPVALIEVLMGITVYGDEDLGAVCISFCDPDEEDCAHTINAESACDVGSAHEVDNPSDLVPNGDGIRGLADAVVGGGFDNDEFRVVEAGETIEAHITFDLDIVTMLYVSETAMVRAFEGQDFTVPYEIEGTVFFDVPELGRYAFGFGPFEGEWAKW